MAAFSLLSLLFKASATAPATRNVAGNPSRLILAQQLGRRLPSRLILKIDVSQFLAVAVGHDKASFQYLDGPRWREAAGGGRCLDKEPGLLRQKQLRLEIRSRKGRAQLCPHTPQ
jgi:hypothetical protein